MTTVDAGKKGLHLLVIIMEPMIFFNTLIKLIDGIWLLNISGKLLTLFKHSHTFYRSLANIHLFLNGV